MNRSPVLATKCHRFWGGGNPCTVVSHIQKEWVGPRSMYSEVPFRSGGSMYGEIQCIMGDSHVGPPCGQNDGEMQLKTLPSRNCVCRR